MNIHDKSLIFVMERHPGSLSAVLVQFFALDTHVNNKAAQVLIQRIHHMIQIVEGSFPKFTHFPLIRFAQLVGLNDRHTVYVFLADLLPALLLSSSTEPLDILLGLVVNALGLILPAAHSLLPDTVSLLRCLLRLSMGGLRSLLLSLIHI